MQCTIRSNILFKQTLWMHRQFIFRIFYFNHRTKVHFALTMLHLHFNSQSDPDTRFKHILKINFNFESHLWYGKTRWINSISKIIDNFSHRNLIFSNHQVVQVVHCIYFSLALFLFCFCCAHQCSQMSTTSPVLRENYRVFTLLNYNKRSGSTATRENITAAAAAVVAVKIK